MTLTLRFGGKVMCCIHKWLRQEIQMDCCDFDYNLVAKCCVVFIYGLGRKSRWTIVTLTLRLNFDGKVLC